MSGWHYANDDIGIKLFDACFKAGAPMTFAPGMRALDLGCSEACWLELARKAWPETEFVGVDQRPQRQTRTGVIVGDVLQPDLFPAASFDAVVAISSIEHIGLGHYQDPVNADGDSIAMANVHRWLKPGGWVYLDVPYDPTGYRLKGTKCRVYSGGAVIQRLGVGSGQRWVTQWADFAEHATSGTLLGAAPRTPVDPFHYMAMVWTKPHSPDSSR